MIFPRGLKANIITHIAGLLLLGMILIDFVTIITVQRDLLKSERARGLLLLSEFSRRLVLDAGSDASDLQLKFESQSEPGGPQQIYSCFLVLDRKRNVVVSEGSLCYEHQTIFSAVEKSISTGKTITQYFGTTWGVFWFQSRYLLLSQPIQRDNVTIGGSGMILPLEGIFQNLQRSQRVLLIYMVINTILLTLIGFYRLSKVYLDPIYRLVKRAEDYREDEDMLFAVRKEDNELNQLSKALNQMLLRISKDKEKLRLTVQSLENANVDLKRAQREILQAEKLASVGRLSSGIAHEIGNPIGIIMGYLDLMKNSDITPKDRDEFIKRTEAELNRINTTIRQLLDFSRPPSDGIKPVYVHEIINELTEVVKFQPFMAEISLNLELDAHTDVVLADANQLRQVFLNLMINAADAISSGNNSTKGHLSIESSIITESSVSADREELHHPLLQICFIDNGHGISSDNLGNIFDPFYTTKEPGKGTGLGLSVSFMIIESLGGTIKAESTLDKGTTMTIFLPVSLDGRKH